MGVGGTSLLNLTPDDPEANVLASWGRAIGDTGYETDLSTSQVVDVRYSLVRPDGTAGVDLTRSTAIGPIYWSRGDRYIAFDRRFEARTLAQGTQAARLIALAQSGPWAPRVLRLAVGVEVARNSNSRLVTASPSGKEQRQLTSAARAFVRWPGRQMARQFSSTGGAVQRPGSASTSYAYEMQGSSGSQRLPATATSPRAAGVSCIRAKRVGSSLCHSTVPDAGASPAMASCLAGRPTAGGSRSKRALESI